MDKGILATKMEIRIITTADGSHSLMNTELNETYHSVHGAIQESVHIFIQSGIDYYVRKNNARRVNILEVGFGTGLNALLTIDYGRIADIQIDYESLEAYPLSESIASQLNYPELLSIPDAGMYFKQLHSLPWNTRENITPRMILKKRHEKLESAPLPDLHFDVVYFDAFAPSKQPNLWELPILAKIYASMKPGGIFVTYCAKGQFKRDLKSLGLEVETLSGPPGKKQMVRATRIS